MAVDGKKHTYEYNCNVVIVGVREEENKYYTFFLSCILSLSHHPCVSVCRVDNKMSTASMATSLGYSKVFILDKYFSELQKFWETEKRLQGTTKRKLFIFERNHSCNSVYLASTGWKTH